MADVDSRQMQDMKGTLYVPVEEKPEEPKPVPETPKEENVAAAEADTPVEDKPQSEATEENQADQTNTEQPKEGATTDE